MTFRVAISCWVLSGFVLYLQIIEFSGRVSMENFDFGRLQEWLLQIVLIFVLIQFVVFGRAWRNLSKQVSWHVYTNAWASILTVIGIFGTFLGIFIGLLAFDIGNIEGSIPGLLVVCPF